MKTSDYYFRGFPALWNVAAFYLFLLKPAPWLGAVAIAALAVLTFVPFHVVHPIRIAHLRALTIAAMVVWALLAIYAVAKNLDPGILDRRGSVPVWQSISSASAFCAAIIRNGRLLPHSVKELTHAATRSTHRRRQPRHRRCDRAAGRPNAAMTLPSIT